MVRQGPRKRPLTPPEAVRAGTADGSVDPSTRDEPVELSGHSPSVLLLDRVGTPGGRQQVGRALAAGSI